MFTYQIQRGQTFSSSWAPTTQVFQLQYLPDGRVDDPPPGNLTNTKEKTSGALT